jgi:microcystin-dependent protein
MQQVRMKKIFLLALVIVLFAVPYSYGGVPQLINYQGKLTNATGAPVPDGNHDVVFKVYDVATGGTALWTETWNSGTSQVKTNKGVFNAMLGTYNTIPATFFADNSVTYLGIVVGTDSEMTPRQRITSVGYAFEAGNGVPKGGIMMWSGSINQIPAGWALCDGTNGTPDLRDRFIVGSGTTYPVGSIGGNTTKDLSHTHATGDHILTIDEMPSHDHNLASNGDVGSGHGTVRNDLQRQFGGHVTNVRGGSQPHNHGATSISGSASQDIMPPYYALAFIMKL